MGKGSARRRAQDDTAYKDGWERIYGNKSKNSLDGDRDQCDAGSESVDDQAVEADEAPWCCRPQIP